MSTDSRDTSAADARLVRVEKGQASPEELAAITALLMARAARGDGAAGERPDGRSPAAWRRLERRPAYQPPHSWQG